MGDALCRGGPSLGSGGSPPYAGILQKIRPCGIKFSFPYMFVCLMYMVLFCGYAGGSGASPYWWRDPSLGSVEVILVPLGPAPPHGPARSLICQVLQQCPWRPMGGPKMSKNFKFGAVTWSDFEITDPLRKHRSGFSFSPKFVGGCTPI